MTTVLVCRAHTACPTRALREPLHTTDGDALATRQDALSRLSQRATEGPRRSRTNVVVDVDDKTPRLAQALRHHGAWPAASQHPRAHARRVSWAARARVHRASVAEPRQCVHCPAQSSSSISNHHRTGNEVHVGAVVGLSRRHPEVLLPPPPPPPPPSVQAVSAT